MNDLTVITIEHPESGRNSLLKMALRVQELNESH